MKKERERKNFIECFSDFLGDPEGLTQEELDAELKEQGIDVTALENRVLEIIKKASEERRLAWLKHASDKRAKIQALLDSKRLVTKSGDLKKRILEILEGNYGQTALSHAEAYFRKRETFSEEDMKSLIEDLEDLHLLDESGGGEK